MRLCLRPIIQAEYRFYHSIQLIGQMDRSCPSAIRSAVVLELLQVDTERRVELRHRPGENHSAARRVLLNHRKTVTVGKFLHRGQVGRLGAELLREILTRDVTGRRVAGGQLADSRSQYVARATPHEHGDFEPLARVRLTD